MKKYRYILLTLLVANCLGAHAEQVGTFYFLENTPLRHTINPAFQPVSNGYISFTPIGFFSANIGNNRITLSDLVYTDPITGGTILALNPDNGDRMQLLNTLGNNILTNFDIDMSILNIGWRYKHKGYIYLGISEHIDGAARTTTGLAQFALNNTLDEPLRDVVYDLSGTQMVATGYMEIMGGYSHKINEKWTVGGKAKLLLGQAYAGTRLENCNVTTNYNQLSFEGLGDLVFAGPINYDELPDELNYEYFANHSVNSWVEGQSVTDYLKPRGYGAAFDLGFTYNPHPQVQITAAVRDLGFICWQGKTFELNIDSMFYNGVDEDLTDYIVNNSINSDSLFQDVMHGLEMFGRSIHANAVGTNFTRMTNMRLNVGIDANFVHNLLGIGVFSSTQLYDNHLYESLTIGGSIRPCNWFNFAVSYSLMNNAKYSNFGAGISLMPYDGINLTAAVDYIPTHYANYTANDGTKVSVPYESSGFNFAVGLSIVWGTNHDRDEDKDGVLDEFDMSPHTPEAVMVDNLGCPFDKDGDGVPDYLDNCPDTRPEAYGFVDGLGCEIDSDHDGVPNWKDQDNYTPTNALGYVDEFGRTTDSDGDGVPDWKDKCPNTPHAAIGHVDSLGCETDGDGDGVPDWCDKCPKTPRAAFGHLDKYGCELDSDQDGVPDWKDECPTTAGPAYNKGCPVMKKEVRTLLQKAMQGIEFETGKATIKKVSYPLLDQIAQTFVGNKSYIVEVQGHTDNVGKAAQNKKLSQQRAESVMNYLIKAGVEPERLTAVGYGSEKPIADNRTKEGRATNRRVEFNITFEEVTYENVLEHVDTNLYQEYKDSIQSNDTTNITF